MALLTWSLPSPLPSPSRCGPGRVKGVQIKPGWETQMPHLLALSSTLSPGPGFLYKSLGPQGKEGRRERGICSSDESLIQLIEKPPHWQLILPALLSVQTSEKHSK